MLAADIRRGEQKDIQSGLEATDADVGAAHVELRARPMLRSRDWEAGNSRWVSEMAVNY